MINRIDEITYLPSLRCNLNCRHCGENQDIGQSQEVDGKLILKRLRESLLVRTRLISVTGGEPFLNSSFPQFVLQTLQETDFHFWITSNGYFFDAIAGLVNEIREEDKTRITIRISIDGTETTHNSIRRNPHSYDMAVKTVAYLHEHGIPCGINSVVQESNLKELKEMEQTFVKRFPGVAYSFGPVATDVSEDSSYEYTTDYQKTIWEYLKDPLTKRRVLSKGRYGITHCNAGKRNIAIGPDGKVYACLTGAFYKDKVRREDYLLGDFKTNSLDEIFAGERAEKVRSTSVCRCEGCTNPCEVVREIDLFGMSYCLPKDEVSRAFELESSVADQRCHILGNGLLDCDGWHWVEWDKMDAGGAYVAGVGAAVYKDAFAPVYS